MQDSAITGDDVQSGQERYGVLGVLAGLVVALLIAALVDRRRARKARRVAVRPPRLALPRRSGWSAVRLRRRTRRLSCARPAATPLP